MMNIESIANEIGIAFQLHQKVRRHIHAAWEESGMKLEGGGELARALRNANDSATSIDRCLAEILGEIDLLNKGE